MTLILIHLYTIGGGFDTPTLLTIFLTNNFYIIHSFFVFMYMRGVRQLILITCIYWINTHNSFFFIPVGLQNRIFLIHPLLLFFVTYTLFKSFSFLKHSNLLYNTSPLRFSFKLLCIGLCSFTLFLGGFWAQQEFNWGGWWSWDSVEMSSILLWLFILYYIHTPVKLLSNLWCLRLLSLYFYSIILIIWFINRSNLFSSIHAFTSSYTYLYLFIYLCVSVSIYIFSSHIYYIPHFKTFWKSVRNLIFIFTVHWCWLFLMGYNVTRFTIYYYILFSFSLYTFVLQRGLVVTISQTLKLSVRLIHSFWVALFLFFLISYNFNHSIYLFTNHNIYGLVNFSFLHMSFYYTSLISWVIMAYFMFQNFIFFKPIVFFSFYNIILWVYKQTTLGITGGYLYYWLWL